MKKILIVDDSSSLRSVLRLALEKQNYTVCEAGSGLEGLEFLKVHNDVNLIISDINMPKMDGISMVKEIKKLSSYRFVPIIMLTTESDDDKKMEGKKAGVKAWLVKPFSPDILKDILDRVFI